MQKKKWDYLSSYIVVTEGGVWAYRLGTATIDSKPMSYRIEFETPNQLLTVALKAMPLAVGGRSLVQEVGEMRIELATLTGVGCTPRGEKWIGLLGRIEKALEKEN